MNYIHQLKLDIQTRDAAIATAQLELQEFLEFLASDKFTGVDSTGERKDWIATGDVVRWVQALRSTLEV